MGKSGCRSFSMFNTLLLMAIYNTSIRILRCKPLLGRCIYMFFQMNAILGGNVLFRKALTNSSQIRYYLKLYGFSYPELVEGQAL